MQFHDDSESIVKLEPLSNFDIDKTTVTMTLVRTGDLSYTTSVMYEVREQDSQATISEGVVVFNRNETQKEIEIVLRANHGRDEEPSLIVQLFNGRLLGDATVPVRVGTHYRAEIVIINREYGGPFFPDLPIVENVGEAMIAGGESHTLYYDQPLLCITVSPKLSL